MRELHLYREVLDLGGMAHLLHKGGLNRVQNHLNLKVKNIALGPTNIGKLVLKVYGI